MTATTTLPSTTPSHGPRYHWVALAVLLTIATAVVLSMVVLDDDVSSADRGQATREATVSDQGAVTMSADAAERWSAVDRSPMSADAAERWATVDRSSAPVTHAVSADAAERRAQLERSSTAAACRGASTSPDAIERCASAQGR